MSKTEYDIILSLRGLKGTYVTAALEILLDNN